MSDLPIIDVPVRPPNHLRSTCATLLRCAGVVLLSVLLSVDDMHRTAEHTDNSAFVVDVKLVLDIATNVTHVTAMGNGLWQLHRADGESAGLAALTLPESVGVIGYRGPSNVLLVLNEKLQIVTAKLVSSDDTPEHINAILKDQFFFEQFAGWTMGDPVSFTGVDATSGATLTSLAIAEAIAVRLGGEKPSLRFPDDLSSEDLKTVLDTPDGLTLVPIDGIEAQIIDVNGVEFGRLIRTGPLVDSLAGYQGPSEIIIVLDSDGRTENLALRRTYDNKPYVDYLNEEPWFWKTFQEKKIQQLATLDHEQEQVEGISGATMTSIAVAETIIAAARQYAERQSVAADEIRSRRIHWTRHDTGTAFVLIGAIVIGLSRLRGSIRLRNCWNVILVGYMGLVTGNLISLAVVAGWAAHGLAWRLAPGLAAVIVSSFILPVATKRNLYCSHLCPHGAAQQLLRGRLRWKTGIRWLRQMRWLPGLTLGTAVMVTLLRLDWNLAAWEPFNAYIWYIAGGGSIILAVASLTLSAAVPMAYCRYACATGRLLEYLRRTARSDRLTLADGMLSALIVAAIVS